MVNIFMQLLENKHGKQNFKRIGMTESKQNAIVSLRYKKQFNLL